MTTPTYPADFPPLPDFDTPEDRWRAIVYARAREAHSHDRNERLIAALKQSIADDEFQYDEMLALWEKQHCGVMSWQFIDVARVVWNYMRMPRKIQLQIENKVP